MPSPLNATVLVDEPPVIAPVIVSVLFAGAFKVTAPVSAIGLLKVTALAAAFKIVDPAKLREPAPTYVLLLLAARPREP